MGLASPPPLKGLYFAEFLEDAKELHDLSSRPLFSRDWWTKDGSGTRQLLLSMHVDLILRTVHVMEHGIVTSLDYRIGDWE